MESIEKNFEKIKQSVAAKANECGRNPDEIRIIAVSKTQPVQAVKNAVKAGVNILGENYIQECPKQVNLLIEP